MLPNNGMVGHLGARSALYPHRGDAPSGLRSDDEGTAGHGRPEWNARGGFHEYCRASSTPDPEPDPGPAGPAALVTVPYPGGLRPGRGVDPGRAADHGGQ